VLEAMSHGCAVLVSNIEGMLEAVDDERTGFVFRDGEPAHLAQRVAEIFGEPGRAAQVAAAGLAAVCERNDWRRLGAQVLASYRLALAAAGTR
jgi:phosphatidyl-myo-inositol alpha-mannosyltransferase